MKAASCSTCSLASGNPLDRLATLGYQSQNNPLLPVKHSLFKGFPIGFVSSATGELSFAMTDLAFKDNPLLLFQRTYDSSRGEDSGLGRGWSFAFNDSITLGDDNATLTTSTGDKFVFRRAEAKSYVLQTPEAADVQGFEVENGSSISAKNGDVTKTYKRAGNAFYLSEITAPNGWEVSIKRNGNGKITNISSISGEINLNWSNGSNAKLLAVTDSAGRRVSFGQSNGLLQSATTATGGIWQYEYANGRLSRAVDPANRIALRAKYDASGRASELGDAAGINRLAYESNADNVSTITTVTDSLNYARAYQQTRRGMPSAVTDKEGTLLNLLYNEANRVVQMTDANGATTIFNFDAEQRLTRQLLPNGDEKTFEYNKNGKLAATTDNGERTEIVYDEANLAESRIRRNGRNVKSIFNRRGQEVRLEVENGLTVNSEYDEKGRKTADVYSDTGRFENTFDAAGRKTSEKMPSGYTHSYEYNSINEIILESDSKGRTVEAEYDASGALSKLTAQNGFWLRFTRDEAGRIAGVANSQGQSRHYVYDARGALTEYVNADGKHLRYKYNQRGQFQEMVEVPKDDGLNNSRSQQSAKFGLGNLWTIQKTNFTLPVASIKSKVRQSCLTGGADSFNWDSFANSGSSGSCGDMFMPEMSSGEGFFGGGGETCYQCTQRETRSCQSTYQSNTLNNGGVLLGVGTPVCIGLAIATIEAFGVGGLVCQAFVSGGATLVNIAAANTRDNCLTQVAHLCESKCNPR